MMFEASRAYLFDFDGTLVEPSIDFGRMHDAVLEIAGAFGLDMGRLRGMHVLELIRRGGVELAAGSELAARSDGESQDFAAQGHRAVLDLEMEAAERVAVYDGVPGMLTELGERGLGVGIVTRNARVAVNRILARIPMHHDVLLTRDDVLHVKPDPRHLTQALQVLGVPGHEAVMTGDHVMDVEAGKRVGASTVGVLKPGCERDYFSWAEPDLVLDRVTDLLDHLPQV